MVGYLFMGFILLIAGIYFSAYQLTAAYPKFEYTLNAMTFVFLIAVPILTMRVLAEERKQKTDQLLLTSPVSVFGIVMGKYLALVTIYAIPIVILATYPLIMSKFGTVAFGSAYTALLGFFLLGCANIAIGVFFSAITESQVIAAVLTSVFLFDEWNFLILFTDSNVNLCDIRAACYCTKPYDLQYDQKCCDLRCDLCCW